MSKKDEQRDAEEAPNDVTNGPAPPLPPDGGWGWVVTFASFMVNVIVDGVCFSFGIFYLEFLNYYGASKSATSWVGSVLNGMYLSMGPIVSALANRFGCRKVSIAGSIVATLAFLLSTLSPNINVLIFLYGGLGGFGFGLMYLPAIVMVGFYFEKRRAFATGIAVCGSGIGAFVFAPLCEKLLSIYEWKGATFIMAGLVLNGAIMGMLFRPLDARPPASTKPPEVVVSNVDGDEKTRSQSELANGKSHRVRTNSVPSPGNLSLQIGENFKNKNQEDLYLQSMHDLSPTDTSTSAKLFRSMDDISSKPPSKNVRHRGNRLEELRKPMYRKDIFYSGSITHLPEYKSTEDVDSYVRSVTNVPDTRESEGGCGNVCISFFDTMKTMMDFSLLKNPVFAIYGASCFLCMAGFYVPFIYLPDHAIERGMSRDQAAFLLSIIGIANTIARVLCGWVSDQTWANSLQINNFALIIGGGATMIAPHCGNYGLLATYASVFGASIAVFVSLRSILMVELIGLDRLTNAFGLVTMCQGLSAFIGAPIAGLLYDWTGNYNISFYSAGAALALAGVICLPLRRVARWQKQKELEAAENRNIYKPVSGPNINGHATNA